MKALSTRIQILGSPDQIWHVLTDFDRYPDWNPYIQWAVGECEMGGDLVIQCRGTGWQATTLHCCITEWQPNSSLRWEWWLGARWMCHGVHHFTIRADAQHGCLFGQQHTLTGPLLTLFAGRFCESFNEGIRAMDHALKSRVEYAIHNHHVLHSLQPQLI